MSDTRKSAVSMRRELTRVQSAMRRRNLPERVRAELYSAQQSLCWALGDENTMAPCRAALLGVPPRRSPRP